MCLPFLLRHRRLRPATHTNMSYIRKVIVLNGWLMIYQPIIPQAAAIWETELFKTLSNTFCMESTTFTAAAD